jgi:hypothetical protein
MEETKRWGEWTPVQNSPKNQATFSLFCSAHQYILMSPTYSDEDKGGLIVLGTIVVEIAA